MSTNGLLDWNSISHQLIAQIFNLSNTTFEIRRFSNLVQPNSQGIHIATSHSTVSNEPFEHDVKSCGLFVPILIPGSDKSTDVNDPIFFTAHGHTIGIRIHFDNNFADSFISISKFTLTDKPGVFSKTSRIHNHRNAIFGSELFHFTNVLQRNWLSARCIAGYGNDNERNGLK